MKTDDAFNEWAAEYWRMWPDTYSALNRMHVLEAAESLMEDAYRAGVEKGRADHMRANFRGLPWS